MPELPPNGRDGTPCRPGIDLDEVNAELQLARAGRLGVPPLPRFRKALPHESAVWLADGAVWFLTICCQERGRNQLARESVGDSLLQSALFFHERRWFVHLFLLMPDHLHALIGFPPDEKIQDVVRAWKKYQATRHGIVWQRDFFDHRLRRDESVDEKARYIRMNPVRAGLARVPEEWPYVLAFEGRGGTPYRP